MLSLLLSGSLPLSSAELGVPFPQCLSHNTVVRNFGQAVVVDVSEDLVSLGAFAEGCNEGNCQATDKFRVNEAEACGKVCARVDACQFWSFGVEDGMTKCWVRSGDAGRQSADGFVTGAATCAPPVWPDCIEKETVIRNAGKALFFDATAFGSDAIDGCYQSDCSFTDKFLVRDPAECGQTCARVPDCSWWSFGEEDGLQKCWLRLADDGRERNHVFVSGSRKCGEVAPERKSKWTQGDNQCWGAGFTEEMCCDERYGPRGNPSCWDAAHTFEMCCLGQKPYWDGEEPVNEEL